MTKKLIKLRFTATSQFLSLTPLLKGSEVPTETGLHTGARKQFWPDALPAITNDSYGYQWELNQGSLGAGPSP